MNDMEKHAALAVALAGIPELAALDTPQWRAALEQAKLPTLPPGAVVFSQNDDCSCFLQVLDGRLRVQQSSSQGREITLYRVEAGQTCVLTVACLMAGRRYSAQGMTETQVTALAIPRAPFVAALHATPALQRYVYGQFSDKLHHMFGMFEQMAFGNFGVRLAHHLLTLAGDADSLAITHEKLASELGTDRVVVSRTLKEFERDGMVRCQRGRLGVTRAALEKYLALHPL